MNKHAWKLWVAFFCIVIAGVIVIIANRACVGPDVKPTAGSQVQATRHEFEVDYRKKVEQVQPVAPEVAQPPPVIAPVGSSYNDFRKNFDNLKDTSE